ncbi:MAG: sensor histidine kinase [Alphaproteobacteria bacterium]
MKWPFWLSFHSLSARLLVLTVAFVMLAEVLIYVPAIARFRVTYLETRLNEAHLAVTALHATPGGLVDPELQRRLLRHAQLLSVAVKLPGAYKVLLGPDMPPDVDVFYDLRESDYVTLVADAFETLLGSRNRVLAVAGPAPKDRTVSVEAFLNEAPLRTEMIAFSRRILNLSIFISVVTAALVYLALQWLLVVPMRRLVLNITGFRAAPEDESRTLQPSDRRDEIGTAERALRDMQQELRAALTHKARLAGVGTAVAKISHDLKGMLTSAMLESDRLEATVGGDPELRSLTSGLCRALDRAVVMCSRTLSFAKEGPPSVQLARLSLRALVDEVLTGFEGAAFENTIPADRMVEMDPELSRRVLENLVRNAIEAGARHLSFKVEGDRLLVIDDGPGLPPRARQNLFQPFSGSARPGGTGLGLPIARELMVAQGGDLLLLETGPGGTVFALRLRPSRFQNTEVS